MLGQPKNQKKCNLVSKPEYIVKEMNYKNFYDCTDLAEKLIVNRNADQTEKTVKWLNIKCVKFIKGHFGRIY